MHRGRLSHRISAFAVLATLLAAVFLPAAGLAHSPDAEDLAWGDGSFVTHHARAQFESIRPTVADDHCVACHLLRAVSAARPRPLSHVSLQSVRLARRAATSARLRSGRRCGVPSRAPPVSSS